MYSYFLVWSPASKPFDENCFSSNWKKKSVENWNSPSLLASVLFLIFSTFFLIFKFCHERRIRASGLIYKSVVIPLVQPNEEQKIRKPVWTVSCKFLFFNRCEIASSGNWNRISLNMMNDLLPLGYFFWCAQYRFQTERLMCMWTLLSEGKRLEEKTKTNSFVSPSIFYFFSGVIRYIFGWAAVVTQAQQMSASLVSNSSDLINHNVNHVLPLDTGNFQPAFPPSAYMSHLPTVCLDR